MKEGGHGSEITNKISFSKKGIKVEINTGKSKVMDIKLKNIHIDLRLSEETNAFTADLFINGKNAGTAVNDGHGGMTSCRPKDRKGAELIREAEIWCEKQRPEVVKNEDESTFTISMSLDYYLDRIIDEHIAKKEQARFEKLMVNSIIFGIPGGVEYRRIKFTRPIRDLLKTEAGFAALKNVIVKKVLPALGERGKIQNRNIPQDILDRIGIPKDKLVEQAGVI
jgi:hypothetical protein